METTQNVAKHTTGPWCVTAPIRTNSQKPTISTADDRPYNVAVVCGGIGPGGREANARLIAAAPQMLEALEEIAEWCENAKRMTGIEPWGLAVAKAAIAAAKGEA
jgi:hypothetical protein